MRGLPSGLVIDDEPGLAERLQQRSNALVLRLVGVHELVAMDPPAHPVVVAADDHA
jgi:hypothetical protein